MNEVAELVVPLDGGGWSAHDTKLLLGRLGRCEIQRAVRPMGVVVAEEDAEHALEVAPVDDQEPVEALAADGANEALGKSRSPSALALVS